MCVCVYVFQACKFKYGVEMFPASKWGPQETILSPRPPRPRGLIFDSTFCLKCLHLDVKWHLLSILERLLPINFQNFKIRWSKNR